jgi:hypothetical protein
VSATFILNERNYKKIIIIVAYWAQFLLPLFLFSILPSVMNVDGAHYKNISYPKLTIFLTLATVLNGIYLLINKNYFLNESDKCVKVSNFSILYIIFFFIAIRTGIPSLNNDDYHYGETLLPWYSLKKTLRYLSNLISDWRHLWCPWFWCKSS